MRTALSSIAMLILLPGPAAALPEFRLNCEAPSCITLVGSAGGVPAARFGAFDVIIRDLANNPIANASVTIDLSACPDLHLCADQLDPGTVVDCAHETVSRLTDANGFAHFVLLGGSSGAGNASELQNA